MLLKEYFTDGLLQVAIVLSLLRTDFDLYFGTQYLQQWHRPELQEILLGPHLGYTQTDFHSRTGWRASHLYPKHIDFIRREEVLRDLHSLADYRRFDGVQTNIDTWLVNGPEPQLPQAQLANQAQQNPPTATAGQPDINPVITSVPHESQNSSNEDSGGQSFSAYFGTELTKEDMDLIDILWRQDIDLGISRDMFDTSLRQEQEKEYSKKLNETEELKKNVDEQNTIAENFVSPTAGAVIGNLTNYHIDNETGELIPVTPTVTADEVTALWEQINILNGNSVNSVQTNEVISDKNETNHNSTMDSFFNEYSTFHSMEAATNNLLGSELESAGLQLNDGDLEESWEDVLSLLSEQSLLTLPSSGSYTGATVPQTSVVGQQAGVVSDILADLDVINISQTAADNITRNSVLFSELMTQRSVEANNLWSSLDLNMSTNLQTPLLNNVSLVESLPTSFSASSTMMPINNTASSFSNFSSTQLFLQTQPLINSSLNSSTSSLSPIFSLSQSSTPTGNVSALFSALTDNTYTNSTFGSNSLISQLNITSSANVADLPAVNVSQSMTLTPYANNDTFIQQLLQNDLSDLTFDDNFDEDGTSLNYDGLHENWSTDSAVSSMHSPDEVYGAASSYRDDTSVDGMEEELEGATGGSKDEIKYSEMLAYTSYSGYNGHKPHTFSPDSNSSSTNSSQPQYQPDVMVPSRKHVAHNHTYYLQPGQKSREEKEAEARREREERSTRCKDAKRAQMMKIPLSIEEIIDLPVDQFTELLSRHTLSEAQHQLIRDIRRRGKNKAAAQNCRKRKLEVIQTLEDEVEGLRRERDFLRQSKTKVSSETMAMRDKFARLQADMLRTLRDASGQQYNPDEYTLQLTSDGDIILVPRNTSTNGSNSGSNGRRTTASYRQPENLHDESDPRKRKPKRKD